VRLSKVKVGLVGFGFLGSLFLPMAHTACGASRIALQVDGKPPKEGPVFQDVEFVRYWSDGDKYVSIVTSGKVIGWVGCDRTAWKKRGEIYITEWKDVALLLRGETRGLLAGLETLKRAAAKSFGAFGAPVHFDPTYSPDHDGYGGFPPTRGPPPGGKNVVVELLC
jgi:hypothetical protein